MSGFYEDKPEPKLRFGDIITGFQVAFPQIHKPITTIPCDWGISVIQPLYLVILTPCCSIEKKSFNLAPLFQIRPAFLDNEYFKSDLTHINRKVQPELSVPREIWENKLPPERKEKLLAAGVSYTNLEIFIYAPHDLLEKYILNRKPPIKMGYYLIDFKTICRIDCNEIEREKNAPTVTKILQLTIPVRQELREKLAFYYGRVPDEDLP